MTLFEGNKNVFLVHLELSKWNLETFHLEFVLLVQMGMFRKKIVARVDDG